MLIRATHRKRVKPERIVVPAEFDSETLLAERVYVLVQEEHRPRWQRGSNDRDWFDAALLFAKRWQKLLFAVCAGTILGLATSFLIPAKYEATARIMPPQQSQTAMSTLAGQLPSAGLIGAKELGLKNPSDLYVDMLQSRTVADELIQQFDLRKAYRSPTLQEAREKLSHRTVVQAAKDGIITISVQDHDAKKAAAIANAYVAALYRLNQSLAITEASQRRLFYEQQLERAKDDLAQAEVDLKQISERTGVFNLDGQAKAAVDTASHLQALITAKRVELQTISSFATEQNPDLQRLRQELAALQRQEAILESKQVGRELSGAKFPEAGLQYIRGLREVKYRETLFEIIARQFEAARMDESKNAALVQVLDSAVEAERPSSPVHSLFATAGAGIGLLLTVLIALLQEMVRRWRADPARRGKLRLLSMYLHNAHAKG